VIGGGGSGGENTALLDTGGNPCFFPIPFNVNIILLTLIFSLHPTVFAITFGSLSSQLSKSFQPCNQTQQLAIESPASQESSHLSELPFSQPSSN
jgi:hypothetical protein